MPQLANIGDAQADALACAHILAQKKLFYKNTFFLAGDDLLFGRILAALNGKPVFGNSGFAPVLLLHYSEQVGLTEFRAGSFWTLGVSLHRERIQRLTNVPNMGDIKAVYAMQYAQEVAHANGTRSGEYASFACTRQAGAEEVTLFQDVGSEYFVCLPFSK